MWPKILQWIVILKVITVVMGLKGLRHNDCWILTTTIMTSRMKYQVVSWLNSWLKPNKCMVMWLKVLMIQLLDSLATCTFWHHRLFLLQLIMWPLSIGFISVSDIYHQEQFNYKLALVCLKVNLCDYLKRISLFRVETLTIVDCVWEWSSPP